MLGNLDEIIQNNLIKDYELREIVTTLTNIGIKPLKFLGIFNDFVAIETKDSEQCQNRQTLIANKQKVNAQFVNEIVNFSCKHGYISQQIHQKFEIIHIPSAKYTLNTQNIYKKLKNLDKKQLIEIFTSILYQVIGMQNNDNYLGITKDSIQFKRDGSIFLNQFIFMGQENVKYLIQNRCNDQFLMYLPQEVLQNGLYKSSSDIYTLGLYFLEILGLQIDYDVAVQLSNSDYQSIKCLMHQDLVNIITKYMICQDFQKRASSTDLFWLFRFQIEEQLTIQEVSMFIQSNSQLNISENINNLQNSSKQLNKIRLIAEYKRYFTNLINLEPFYQNGCIVTSFQETQIHILLIGNRQSEFENKYIKVVIELELPNEAYPYKPPLFKLENSINSILCGKSDSYVDIFRNEWSPASNIKTSILTLTSILNSSFQQIILHFYCEDHRNKQNIQLLQEEMKKLENIDILFNQYKSQFLKKYSK
ncbi:hypothetical protein ABPG72_008914 [Tetrahymena utriculariae]